MAKYCSFSPDEERNYYKIPELVTTETDFEEYAVKYGGYSYGYKPTSSINDQQYYKVSCNQSLNDTINQAINQTTNQLFISGGGCNHHNL